MLVIFLAWMTFNSFFAYDPAFSWPYWDRTWKTFLLGLVIAVTATSRTRIYALVWIVVISLFYYGVKGGIFTILTGGHYHVFGPSGTIISDNNQLAVALLMTIPFAAFLRNQVADRRIGLLLLAGITFHRCNCRHLFAWRFDWTRGLGLFMLLRVRNRFAYLALAGIVLLFIVNFMPAHFFHRADTIATATQDSSFEGACIRGALRFSTRQTISRLAQGSMARNWAHYTSIIFRIACRLLPIASTSSSRRARLYRPFPISDYPGCGVSQMLEDYFRHARRSGATLGPRLAIAIQASHSCSASPVRR